MTGIKPTPDSSPGRALEVVHHRSGLSPLRRRVAGIDVHRMLHVVTVLIEQPDSSVDKHSKASGGLKGDGRALAAWLVGLQVELIFMESTGIFWKKPLRQAGEHWHHHLGRQRELHRTPAPAQNRHDQLRVVG